jgi:hypothetical protein
MQLDDLGDTRPLLVWLRDVADLRLTCVNSVAVVGSRAAAAYGTTWPWRWLRCSPSAASGWFPAGPTTSTHPLNT